MVQQADVESRAASIGKDQRNVALFPTMAFRDDLSLSRGSLTRRSRI